MKKNELKNFFKNNIVWFYKKTFLLLSLFIFPLAVSGQTQKITFSEINYNSDSTRDAGDWVELHNYGTATLDISYWIFTDSQFNHFIQIPANTMLAAGEYLVICQDSIKFKIQYPTVFNFIGSFHFGLSGKSELIRLIDNQNNIVLAMTYYDSLPWPKGADGHGRTLELIDPLADLNDGNNWFDGCMGGSPGTNFQSCTESIIFSEINYNSHITLNTADWVELLNISTQPVDVSGWLFKDKKDSNSYQFPPNTIIEPGDFLVLAENKSKFSAVFPNVTNVIGPFKFGLKNTNEVIRLFDATGTIYMTVAYFNSPPWPEEAAEPGFTLELSNSGANLNDGNNWFYGCLGGSPGTHYSTPCQFNVSIEEKNILLSSSVYPNPFSHHAILELSSVNLQANGNIILSIYDAFGKIVSTYPIPFNDKKETIKLSLKSEEFTSGIYFYHASFEDAILASGKIVIFK